MGYVMTTEQKALSPWIICVGGAINGLLAGLIAEEARVRYLNYRMGEAAHQYAQSAWAVDFVDAHRDLLVPLVCIVTFAGVSYIVHRYFASRPQMLLFPWSILGAVALGAGYFMSTSKPNVFSFVWILGFAAVSWLAHKCWTSRPQSFSLLWLVIGISAVIVVAVGVQLVGLFFYWPDLRRPLLWLLCLLGVVVISTIYGAVIQFVFERRSRSKINRASA
jgi:hypothetical protein